MDVAVSADDGEKIKENEKTDNYLNFAKEIQLNKNQWNMKMTVIPILIAALGTIAKDLVRGLEAEEIGGQAETIQTTALLRSVKYSESLRP